MAFSRNLTEQLGTIPAASYIYLLSGILSLLYLVSVPTRIRHVIRLPIQYLVGCGILFITYSASFFLAIGLVSNRQQVIELGIINYLWPTFTLVFSVPILSKKARLSLIPGIIIAFLGVLLLTQGGSWEIFQENFRSNALPYILTFVASISWGLYSNLSRRWAGETESGAVPIFLLITGLILTATRIFSQEKIQWSPNTTFKLLYTAIFPTFLAYIFWDNAMRKGRIILIITLSYFIPILSTIISSLILNVVVGLHLWVASILIIAGAIICKYSIIEKAT